MDVLPGCLAKKTTTHTKGKFNCVRQQVYEEDGKMLPSQTWLVCGEPGYGMIARLLLRQEPLG